MSPDTSRERSKASRPCIASLPICAWCKRIRDDQGYWNQVEAYVHDHSEANFTLQNMPPSVSASSTRGQSRRLRIPSRASGKCQR